MSSGGSQEPTTLRRSLSFPLLLLYGLGTTVGAGVYALTGAVVANAGMQAPFSFLLASALVACTALTFGELGSRYPRSASEAVWVRAAFGAPRLGTFVVLCVALAGTVSAATMLTGLHGYLASVVALPQAPVVAVVGLAMGVIAAWGIEESVRVAAAITIVEVVALLAVAVLALASVDGPLLARLPELVPEARPSTWLGIFSGGLLAFYAFLGFEDMVQVAEETVDVRDTLPAAITATLLITTLIYVVLAVACVLAVDPTALATSSAPLAYVFEQTTGRSPALITLVSVFAIANGGLVQIIMAARILYGLSSQGILPDALGRIDPRTRTPLAATALITALVIALAVGFRLEALARITSVIMLGVFTCMNLTLVAMKRLDPTPEGVRVYPAWVPAVGFVTSAAFFVYGLFELVAFAF
ncbi:MAG: APC family permease [Candidatus Binatia bacterium]